MRFSVRLRVFSVRHSVFQNSPVEWQLEQISDPGSFSLEPSTMAFDQRTADYLHLPPGDLVVGKDINFSFVSQLLGKTEGGDINWDAAPLYYLRFKQLERHEVIVPDSGHSHTEMLMHLVSPGGPDGIHPSITPCPFFTFRLSLTKAEFEIASKVPPISVFSFTTYMYM